MKNDHKPSVFKAVISLVFLLVAAWAIINVAVDPYGVFGDKFMDRYDYDMTLSPRLAKVGWLSRHGEDYDSFLLGGVETSGFPVTALNDLAGGKFFDMGMPGANLAETHRIAKYLLENYNVKTLVLCLSPRDAANIPASGEAEHAYVDGSSGWAFYLRCAFANPLLAYDKYRAVKDGAETVYDPATGQRTDGDYSVETGRINDAGITELVRYVSEISIEAEKKGARLIIIGVPLSAEEFGSYDRELVESVASYLTKYTDLWMFWDFGEAAEDAGYFNGNGVFNTAAGRKVLAEVFGNQ